MFRRYPYWGWLLLSLVLWCANGFYFHKHTEAMLPARMAAAVNNDLQHRENAFKAFIKEENTISKLFDRTISGNEQTSINALPFFVFCYEHDTLKYWNTNTIIATCNSYTVGKPTILRNDNGTFVEECFKPAFLDAGKRIVILFPVVISYPLDNDYLKSHFAASDNVPVKTKIVAADSNNAGGYAVSFRGTQPLFFLHFQQQDLQKWMPDLRFILLLLAAILASISWVQLIIIHLTRKRKPVVGFIITLAIILVLRSLLFVYGLPFNLDQLPFFSPQLYAYNRYLSSFGDLFINTVFVLWIVLFVVRHTPYRFYFDKVTRMPARYMISAILMVALTLYVYLFVSFIRSLVLDSNISFDVNHFYDIKVYTLLGLLLIGTVTGISSLVLFLFNIQLSTLIKNNVLKYALIAITAAILLLCSNKSNDGFYWIVLCWMVLFIFLLDRRNFTLIPDLFEPRMIFWAVFICLSCTGIVQYFNQVKEREARKAFVEQRLSPHRDNEMEYAFDKVAKKIAQDKILKGYLIKPAIAQRKIINQRFETEYLTGPISKYQSKVYLFDEQRTGLFNKDSVDFNSLITERNESVTTNSVNLFYKESILDRPYYLSYIPVYEDSSSALVGYVIIDLDLKKQATEAVYPELLQPIVNKASAEENEYAYAVYINDKLITQANNFPFTTVLKDDTLHDQGYAYYTRNRVSELYYKISDKRTIVVAYSHSQLLEVISLFSYLFGVEIILAIMILLYQLYLYYYARILSSGIFSQLTLRKRVHFALLATVLISFIIIGSVTIFFFINRYRDSNTIKLQSAMQTVKQSVQNYLKQEHVYDVNYTFDTVSKSTPFKYFIANLATVQKIDINVFNDRGILCNTSEDDIYNKGLLSHMMRPEAFYQLNDEGKSIAIQNEEVAGLSYLSAYEPLRDEQGKTLGYINIPFFSSEKDLNFQISNIVVTLINLYAIIFLFSSLITVLITGWITRSFNMITQQFSKLNLQRNERISWPHKDEIGTLVSEYNKMVNKVEENAAQLAQSERESAWREMARQVAHEIKNPLTPMKLNIQYLQQAMKNDNPNIKDLTNKVADSIVEQIDNLAYIAAEFSNFAKMPEARPEELELYELLNKAVELYLNDEHIKVTITSPAEKLYVVSDRSQLLRVFTNLLENAKQAIPAERQGRIEVTLVRDNNDAVVTITDNGDGIPEDVVKRIFQPYFTTKSSGTGLGLAMTRKIIEFWKGTIWFETEEGKGTVFFIKLPLTKQA